MTKTEVETLAQVPVAEELPILRLLFVVPVAAAVLVHGRFL